MNVYESMNLEQRHCAVPFLQRPNMATFHHHALGDRIWRYSFWGGFSCFSHGSSRFPVFSLSNGGSVGEGTSGGEMGMCAHNQWLPMVWRGESIFAAYDFMRST